MRGSLWVYFQYGGNHFGDFYQTNIYYSSFCRLDELIFGVAIALLRNFHPHIWQKMTERGNIILLFGMIATSIIFYLFLHYQYSFFMTALGFPLLAISFALLLLAALSPSCYLYHARIPGAATLAIWSYAIYLIHKPISVIVYAELSKWGMNAAHPVAILIIVMTTLASGRLLYVYIESPFLMLREKIGKPGSETQIIAGRAQV